MHCRQFGLKRLKHKKLDDPKVVEARTYHTVTIIITIIL